MRGATISVKTGDRTTTEFYAQPYSLDHTGFYFDSLEKYESGMRALKKRGWEEVEIQFIDGDDHLCKPANAMNINQCNIYLWFADLDDLDETAATQLCFLLDLGYNVDEVLDRYEHVCLYEGKASDYA